MIVRTPRKKATEFTFVLPIEHPPGAVSVVGDFNDWQPGTHPLVDVDKQVRAVTIEVPEGQRVAFRYLAEDGHWFDDEQADWHDGDNGHLAA